MCKRLNLVGLLLALSLIACEKDDICVDGDSALLQIEFRDVSNQEVVKNVAGLSIFLNEEVYQGIENKTVSKIDLALAADQTLYTSDLIKSGVDAADRIVLSVTPKMTYVSRACGFVLEFEGLSVRSLSQKSWISSIEVINESINASNAPHLVIYH
jgi:hypothetical protein